MLGISNYGYHFLMLEVNIVQIKFFHFYFVNKQVYYVFWQILSVSWM